VISELLKQLIQPSGAFQISEREAVTLKGLDGSFSLFEIDWRRDEPPATAE
jgi:hypothetical protein